ncbi:DNA mismatch repair protein [Pseudozyma hubeiensis SY62]|uniref:DNA mismatch repair protein n=1 Tax=Pseudozyma hubeiensis (strain SY62) TaxID=1305764 RepID=R9NXG3_PSEHS|nr:DNA mismatch repair protein [Pseudozyma hubeiensis SY62]GAC93299.1 DNA mismatch repair protein [Pseudozyma hubeiensis SY62]
MDGTFDSFTQFGDVASFIVDKEIEILDRLQILLQECSPILLAAHAALAQIDCLVAFARAATLYDLKRPTLVAEQVIRLKGSRHALKALSDESFVGLFRGEHMEERVTVLKTLFAVQVPNDIELRGGLGLPVEDADRNVNMTVDEHVAQSTGSQEQSRPAFQRAPTTDAVTSNAQHSVMVLTGA